MENNLSETTFVKPVSANSTKGKQKNNEYEIRWFTPAIEVDVSLIRLSLNYCNNLISLITQINLMTPTTLIARITLNLP